MSPLSRSQRLRLMLCHQHWLLLVAVFVLTLWVLTRPVLADEPPLYPSPNERFGFCAIWESPPGITNYDVAQLNAGWYLDFATRAAPPRPDGLEYVQVIRVGRPWYKPETITDTLGPVIDANPGALWLVGNEPDRRGMQDDRTPWEYAHIYHDVYYFIKRRDPTARVAIGGIVQPTPLRLLYLDFVLQEYEAAYGEKIPVDVWNVHNFILREDYTWGAGIPPGMDDYADLGKLYNVNDNDNMAYFRQQIWDFRQWMADHGERNKPLIVTEYGVLMPALYGYGYQRVSIFMRATFDFFLNTTDDQLGYPLDDNRLVQRWAWYSLNDYAFDPQTWTGSNGNLFDHDSRVITPLGQDYADYTASLVVPYVDVSVKQVATPAKIRPGNPLTYTITLVNSGNVPAAGMVVTDVLPSGVAVTRVASSGVVVTNTGGLPYPVWQVSELGRRSQAVITVTAVVTAQTPLSKVVSSTVTVAQDEDLRPGNNSATSSVTLLPPLCVACDLNGNGVVDVADIQAVASRWMDGASYRLEYDVWQPAAPDGRIDLFDIVFIAGQWGQRVP